MVWYNKVVEDIGNVPDATTFFTNQINEAKGEVKLKGNLERASAALPGQIEFRFNQLQEIEAILEYLNIALRKERSKKIRHFMEHYNREMTVREAEKWIDAEDEVVMLSELVNEIALVRNQYLGIMKGLEAKSFQINNITKLRTAGIEDTEIGIL